MIKKFNEFLNEAEEPKQDKKEDKDPSLTFYGHKEVNKDGEEYFTAIYASPFGTKMHGTGDIYELTFVISDNKDISKEGIEYWGWKTDDNKVSMVFPAYFLFNMCFPAGAKKAEEDEEGERVKLTLVGVELFKEKKDEDEEERKRKKRKH
jgi:hypothetical protein